MQFEVWKFFMKRAGMDPHTISAYYTTPSPRCQLKGGKWTGEERNGERPEGRSLSRVWYVVILVGSAHEPHEDGGGLGAGGGALRSQSVALHAVDEAGAHSPLHCAGSPAGDVGAVCKAGEIAGGGHVCALVRA